MPDQSMATGPTMEKERGKAISDKPERQTRRFSSVDIISNKDEEENGREIRISTYQSGKDSSANAEADDYVGCGKQKKTRSLKEIDENLKEIDENIVAKKQKLDQQLAAIPAGFLDPLPSDRAVTLSAVPLTIVPVDDAEPLFSHSLSDGQGTMVAMGRSVSRQFWKAGEFEDVVCANSAEYRVGMDRIRVHPRFLHSNATSHKWALGAFAELLDNALDEASNGATYVRVDVMTNIRDNSKMLLIEDNGGGMTSDKMRHCMSLGYSAKSKIANTIGQYGNGFKTSTMRLGADVVVFSRCMDGNRRSASQSIGMLSYTFLMGTQKEDIVVPMIDFEKKGQVWEKVIRSSSDDWSSNLETILQWSPFTSERNLLKQFDFIESQGTRIFIYNLWEDDEGKLELDFETDPQDIRIRVVNQNKQSTERALLHPNSRHFLTYKHSLRSYASILYLRLPPKFRIILRGCDVQHHSIVNDMLHKQQITYRPQSTTEMSTQHTWMVATVTIGFVKDAHFHGDIQGFNVYHKNRLIKPFWRVWNAAGSSGRGAIGVLEANFVEPAHDKQDFERTIALSRLEARLIVIQKAYWFENCHLIGYSDERSKKRTSPHSRQELVAQPSYRSRLAALSAPPVSGNASQVNPPIEFDRTPTPIAEIPNDRSSPVVFCDINDAPQRAEAVKIKNKDKADSSNAEDGLIAVNGPSSTCVSDSVVKLKQENLDLTRIIDETETRVAVLRGNITLQRDKRESFEKQLVTARRKIEELEKEQAALIKMISEERMQGEEEEEKLRQKLAEASDNIDYLLDKVKRLQEK